MICIVVVVVVVMVVTVMVVANDGLHNKPDSRKRGSQLLCARCGGRTPKVPYIHRRPHR